ncbi:Reticulocyte-binding protein 2 a [Tetrabaena socialis]|uniref:Reticulocyte-binding protein 2 a n=1 Tax=Tetrabaena socialis TaxID=47790 RepID=A0A2J8AHU2_9CHLO|nr:Reticulocyte-binding protein 2 a [Tetrabaena socialis]|eukprot:PNH12088.1 Reticulocyte-binding protein 2 a [Tetrabaena socialis]
MRRSGSGSGSKTDAIHFRHSEQAKEKFTQHTKETSNLDVLSRCKKLNELLSSDVLKGKGDSKAQLKEILGILNAPKARPSFLDKPSATSSAGKRPAKADEKPTEPPALASPRPQQAEDVDDLISLLNSDPESIPLHSCPAGGSGGHVQAGELHNKDAQHQQRRAKEEQEAVERQRKAKQEQEAAEQQRRAKQEQETVERQRRAKEEQEAAERQRRAEQEQEAAEQQRRAKQEEEAAERQRKAKAEQEAAERLRAQTLQLERLRLGAALCIQSQWRAFCARRLAAQRRRALAEQRAAAGAACVLQAAWRARQQSRDHRVRLSAAATLQCAVRSWRARQCLRRLRLAAFERLRAARCIQRAFRAFRSRGYELGPLRVPPQGGSAPAGSQGVDAAALLVRQLRLRSAMDARLAPECAPGSPPAGDGSARNHRTVATHRERVRQVSATERTARCGVGERVTMAASEHRDSVEALAIARQGPNSGGAAPAAASVRRVPSAIRVLGGGDAVRPLSRSGSTSSSSRPGSEGRSSEPLRPTSSLRRMSMTERPQSTRAR